MARTLPGLLRENARRFGTRVALREKEFGIWQPITWDEYGDRVRRFSLGLSELGVARGDKVAIVGDNRPEWLIAELGAQAAGAVSVGIYQDSVAQEMQYVLQAASAKMVVAEDQEQVDKVLEVRNGLPDLKYVVYYDPRGLHGYDHGLLLPFSDVEGMGERRAVRQPDAFTRSIESVRPDDVAVLCTTSGTTSQPKLAMLTHANLLAMAEQLQLVDPMRPEDEFVSFLPLAWIGEQMVSLSCHLIVGFAVNFPEETGTVLQDLREIGPHTMFSPPRIWESLVSELQIKVEDTTRLKRRVFDWSMAVGQAMADARFEKRHPPVSLRVKHRLAEWLALLPVKDQLGISKLRHGYTGGAALGPDVFRFFHALGVNLKQIYGQTEMSGISVLHRDGDIKFQTVGRPLPNTEVRIADGGEILTRSPAMFAGYYEDPEATAQALRDGWLHSGDAGYLDSDGHLVVIDRAQDVMTLADGTTFSPQFIENKLKFSPYIREAVVLGADRPFVVAIINIDFGNTGKWAEQRQIAYTTFADLAQRAPVYELVGAHVRRSNGDLPPAARIRRFLLLHKELDADDAELTRTRKVRRRFVASRYAELIDALYAADDTASVESVISYQDGRTATVRTEIRIETVPTGSA